jgi:hypothetical protein
MEPPISDLRELLAAMNPELHEGAYVFVSVPLGTSLAGLSPLASFCEGEGLTLVLEEAIAERRQLPVLFRAAWISLTVHSDLQAVGLTAAIASALADAGISCNLMAGAFHDHLFVPVASAQQARSILRSLQQRASEQDLGGSR